jgi:hypothetical protein
MWGGFGNGGTIDWAKLVKTRSQEKATEDGEGEETKQKGQTEEDARGEGEASTVEEEGSGWHTKKATAAGALGRQAWLCMTPAHRSEDNQHKCAAQLAGNTVV